jgi:hypothetical protein
MMKTRIVFAAIATGALLSLSGVSVAQDQSDHMLEITEVQVKIGQESNFRASVKAYKDCYEDQGGQGSWVAWPHVGGPGTSYLIVTARSGWAEVGETDAARNSCWSIIEERASPHLDSVTTSFARYMPEWSGIQTEDYTIARIHRFRVAKEKQFRSAVGAMVSILKRADYPHLGRWYDVIGNSSNEPDFFVVSYYRDFAAMDEGRDTPFEAVKAMAGEERADSLWAEFRESLTDDLAYSTVLLRRDTELSRRARE